MNLTREWSPPSVRERLPCFAELYTLSATSLVVFDLEARSPIRVVGKSKMEKRHLHKTWAFQLSDRFVVLLVDDIKVVMVCEIYIPAEVLDIVEPFEERKDRQSRPSANRAGKGMCFYLQTGLN